MRDSSQERPISLPASDDEAAWEDILETQLMEEEQTHMRTPSPAGSVRSSPRKRKPVSKTAKTASQSRRTLTVAVSPRRPRPPRYDIAQEDIIDGAVRGASFTLQYLFVVFYDAILLLRRPLSWMLLIWLLTYMVARLSQMLRPTFAPLCYLPGLHGSRFCQPAHVSGQERTPKWADFPRLVDVQSATFEHLLDEASEGSGLSLEIKKAEMATADLTTLVRVSDLKSRDLLADVLVEFVNDAKRTGSGLQRLSSKIGGAVDSITAVNDYALQAIEESQSKTSWIPNALLPWSRPQPGSEVVTRTFAEAMSVLSSAMGRLILEAEVNLANLNRLEERLLTLHDMVTREDATLSDAKAELLSELWTKLGGNRSTLRNFESHLLLLKNLGMYRKKALIHVVAALQTLQAMSSDMEDIRERVAAPDLTGSRIPVKVHMKSIKSGLERLKEGRGRAKRLEEEALRKALAGEAH